MMNSSIEERGMLYLGFHSRTQDQMTEVQISRVLITVVDVQIRTKDVSMAVAPEGGDCWEFCALL
jgi:hypothetical protein